LIKGLRRFGDRYFFQKSEGFQRQIARIESGVRSLSQIFRSGWKIMADSIRTIDVDTTIAALQQGLTSIPVEQAIAVIESWQQQLQGTDLAEDLGDLKAALSQGDVSSISQILTDLGEDTSEAAADATGDTAVKVEQLGDLLSQAGQSLA
jgi:hypothetical protein